MQVLGPRFIEEYAVEFACRDADVGAGEPADDGGKSVGADGPALGAASCSDKEAEGLLHAFGKQCPGSYRYRLKREHEAAALQGQTLKGCSVQSEQAVAELVAGMARWFERVTATGQSA